MEKVLVLLKARKNVNKIALDKFARKIHGSQPHRISVALKFANMFHIDEDTVHALLEFVLLTK